MGARRSKEVKRGEGAAWRRLFLAALAKGGSVRGAARAAGVDGSSPYYTRRVDAAFAAAWEAALAEGRGRLVRGETPALARDEIVRASRHGRPCVMRVGPGRWSAAKEEIFLTELEAGANVARAADAAGISRCTLYGRRRREPAFRAAWAAAVQGGYLDVEVLAIEHARAVLGGLPLPRGKASLEGRMTAAEALSVLRLHHASVKGGAAQRYDWRAQEPDIEEVRAEILRKVAAMERKRSDQDLAGTEPQVR